MKSCGFLISVTWLHVVRLGGTWGKDKARCAVVSFTCKEKVQFPSLQGYDFPGSLPHSAASDRRGEIPLFLQRQVLAPVFFRLCGCCHARLERGDVIPTSYFCHAVLMAEGPVVPVIDTTSLRAIPRAWGSHPACYPEAHSSVRHSHTRSKHLHFAICGSVLLKKKVQKLLYSGETVTENEVEMVRSAEELDDDREIAICVSSRCFGFLTENCNNAAIRTAPRLPYPQVQSSKLFFQKLWMIQIYVCREKYRDVMRKGTSPNNTDFISELSQFLIFFGFVTEYKSAILPKPRCEASVEVMLSLVGTLGAVWHAGRCLPGAQLGGAEPPAHGPLRTGGVRWGGHRGALCFLLLCRCNTDYWNF